MAEQQRFEAAPIDRRARGLLVGWLTAWFALVAGLLAWSLADGGRAALVAAVIASVLVPGVVLLRLAGFPGGYTIAGSTLTVHRHLLPDRTFAMRRPVVRDTRAAELRRRGVVFGSAYGCRWLSWPSPDGDDHRLFVATSDLEHAIRIDTEGGAVLVTPARPKAFLRAAREAAEA